MNEILPKIIEQATQKFGADYVEIRAQNLSKSMLVLKEGRVEVAKKGIENGVALRVLINGAWGFSSVGCIDEVLVDNIVAETCKMAKMAGFSLKKPIKLAETKPVEERIQIKPQKDPATVSMEEKIRTAKSINKSILDYDKRIKGCTIDYLDLTGSSYFLNSDGACIQQDKLYVWSRVTAAASQNGVFTFSREELGSTKGYELFDMTTPETVGYRAAKRAVDQLDAKPPKGGTYPVVLGPNVVGVFIHEAFGHLAEADLALSGGILANRIGKKIASEKVTFYDDGTTEGAFGSFKYDDEGVLAEKTLLVKDGIVVGLMHNRETAQIFGVKPTGNARAEDFRVAPIIRMRNTFMAPKDCSFEELLEDIKYGYYLKSFRGGQANLDGTFQVGIQEAYEIVKGELGRPVRNASFSGNTLETLHRVDAVGKDLELWPGRCGKGQIAFVCDGGPHTRVQGVMIGGTA